jgi:hypothetical protein
MYNPSQDSSPLALVSEIRKAFANVAHICIDSRELPLGFEYLLLQCDITPFMAQTSISVSAEIKVFTRGKKREKGPLKNWLPDLEWRPMRGGLSGAPEFEAAMNRDPSSPWIDIWTEGKLGLTNAARRAKASFFFLLR